MTLESAPRVLSSPLVCLLWDVSDSSRPSPISDILMELLPFPLHLSLPGSEKDREGLRETVPRCDSAKRQCPRDDGDVSILADLNQASLTTNLEN